MKKRRAEIRNRFQPLPLYPLPPASTQEYRIFTAILPHSMESRCLAVDFLRVDDREEMRQLWNGGCFGKGSQSRSEPVAGPTSGEYLQLMFVEALFLGHFLKVLRIVSEKECAAGAVQEHAFPDLWTRYLVSALPEANHLLADPLPRQIYAQSLPSHDSMTGMTRVERLLTHQRMVEFVSYHWYRSLGWTVRSGIKYGTHWTLYESSPALVHAQYAVMVVPVILYKREQEQEQPQDLETDGVVVWQGKRVQWSDFFTTLRLLVSVKKKLRLCFVVAQLGQETTWEQVQFLYQDPSACLSFYSVREYDFCRWIPDKVRDQ